MFNSCIGTGYCPFEENLKGNFTFLCKNVFTCALWWQLRFVLLGRAETLFVAGYWIAGFGSGIKLRKWIDNSVV